MESHCQIYYIDAEVVMHCVYNSKGFHCQNVFSAVAFPALRKLRLL